MKLRFTHAKCVCGARHNLWQHRHRPTRQLTIVCDQCGRAHTVHFKRVMGVLLFLHEERR